MFSVYMKNTITKQQAIFHGHFDPPTEPCKRVTMSFWVLTHSLRTSALDSLGQQYLKGHLFPYHPVQALVQVLNGLVPSLLFQKISKIDSLMTTLNLLWCCSWYFKILWSCFKIGTPRNIYWSSYKDIIKYFISLQMNMTFFPFQGI